jgi:hypothetical protein
MPQNSFQKSNNQTATSDIMVSGAVFCLMFNFYESNPLDINH